MEDIVPIATSTAFAYSPMFQRQEEFTDDAPRHVVTDWHKVPGDWTSTLAGPKGKTIVEVAPGALTKLAHLCMVEIQHFFRHDHLQGWATILQDDEASDNDKYVALQLLRNACIASGKVLPACQDTGTAIVLGYRGDLVWTPAVDEEELSRGIWESYANHYLRYSQVAPTTMFAEQNTKSNLPAQFDLMAAKGAEYKFLFVAKGGGSANKAFLFQQTKALLNPRSLRSFIREKLKTLGTTACPPYHIALVVGGTSAEMTMKTVKLASCRYYDDLPTSGDATGRAFRDLEWEAVVMEEARGSGIGAQFGGKYFAHQARVIRLPRHGASCPVGLSVSCSADRQILAKINADGMFIEQLVHDPAQYMPDVLPQSLSNATVVSVDMSRPMKEICATLSQYPVRTRLSLTGTLVVARDIAHAKLKEMLDSGAGLPQYVKDFPIYYAGPAKTPDGLASGSFGPTTAGRMDAYVDEFQAAGGSMVMLAKGNRSKAVTDACKKHGGFYLGSIGGPAAVLATDSIKKVEVLEFAELGMEAIWRIDVVDFPAFIIVDDKGNDFFADLI
jgi:fumarate hydratase class I